MDFQFSNRQTHNIYVDEAKEVVLLLDAIFNKITHSMELLSDTTNQDYPIYHQRIKTLLELYVSLEEMNEKLHKVKCHYLSVNLYPECEEYQVPKDNHTNRLLYKKIMEIVIVQSCHFQNKDKLSLLEKEALDQIEKRLNDIRIQLNHAFNTKLRVIA